MENRPSVILCVWLLLSPMGWARDEKTIEVVKEQVTGPRTGGGVSTSRGDFRPPGYASLKLTLLSLDKRGYELGDQVINEVKRDSRHSPVARSRRRPT
ncbi:hypothetical protein D6833_02085 [Candidatus Parcubacteria bacterium]|nr:MAG: hypothetical protein D6833_02085 [Candidatus Parcubacteria bacterium]